MRRSLFLGLALVAAVLAAYGPALTSGFVWNDDTYLTENRTLDGAEGLRLIWTDPKANEQYYPMVFSSFWIEKRLWGLAPFGYHLVNVLLHAGSALLLWLLLVRLGVRGAWFAGALFALHPVCVESVAWVTERKNTLSLFLSFVAIHLWYSSRAAWALNELPKKKRRSLQEPMAGAPNPRILYSLSLACLTLALFAKTTACVVPAVLLVLVWWKSGRVNWPDVRPLLPFFGVSLALAFETAWLERTVVQAAGREWEIGVLGRFVLAGQTGLFYASKLLYPVRLAFMYERWPVDGRALVSWVPTLFAAALVAAAWGFRRRLGRGALAFLLLFLGVLVPAMGFFNVYAMRYSWVADHFAYQAAAVFCAGVAAVAAGAVAGLVKARPAVSRVVAVFGVAVLALLATRTWAAGRGYRDEETLWRVTLAESPSCFMCETNYGNWLLEKGRDAEASPHFERSLSLHPDNVPALLNLARIEETGGRLDGAARHLRSALVLAPTDATVLVNLATVDTRAGRFDEAIGLYGEALRYGAAENAAAHNGLGAALMQSGRIPEAISHFEEALRLDPGYAYARANLDRALAGRADSGRLGP